MGSRQPPQLQTMKMKKTIVWATCLRWRLVSSSGPDQEHGRPGRADQAGQHGPDGQKHGVGPRPGGQLAGDADAAADRIQAEQQEDERPILAENRPQQHVAGQGEIRPADRRQDQVRRRPLALQGKSPPEQVIGQRQCRQDGGDVEAVHVALPPRLGCLQQGKHGDGQQEQSEGQQRPVGRVLGMGVLGGTLLGGRADFRRAVDIELAPLGCRWSENFCRLLRETGRCGNNICGQRQGNGAEQVDGSIRDAGGGESCSFAQSPRGLKAGKVDDDILETRNSTGIVPDWTEITTATAKKCLT